MGKTIVVALGGNAIQEGNGATSSQQQEACYKTAVEIVKLIKAGNNVIVSHGNGPQVGNILLQQAASDSEELPAMPLDTCGAMSQGMIGYWLQNAMSQVLKENNICKNVVTLVTQTEVDKGDSAFKNPTKPIGTFYSKEIAEQLMTANNYQMVEDSGRGFRRVVASPKPVDIVEKDAICSLLNSGFVVIAGGGGGIPVLKEGNKYFGIEAVIDKDFASEKIAELICADYLLILTAVENVAVHFGMPQEEKLSEVSVQQMEKYIEEGHFAPGSMLPKVEASIEFVKSKEGRISIITSLEKAADAIEGITGTRINH